MQSENSNNCCMPSSGDKACVTGIRSTSSQRNPLIFANTGSIEGMIHLEGAHFSMGTEDNDAWVEDGEGPVRQV